MSLQLHSTSQLDIYSACSASQLEIPVVTAGISAGFPSPAMDFIDLTIDMNRHLVKHPSATFYGRPNSASRSRASLDKSLEPKNDKIAVCYLDGEFTVKRIKVEKGSVWLIPANTDFQPIQVTEDNDFLIWGIVTHVIKAF